MLHQLHSHDVQSVIHQVLFEVIRREVAFFHMFRK